MYASADLRMCGAACFLPELISLLRSGGAQYMELVGFVLFFFFLIF